MCPKLQYPDKSAGKSLTLSLDIRRRKREHWRKWLLKGGMQVKIMLFFQPLLFGGASHWSQWIWYKSSGLFPTSSEWPNAIVSLFHGSVSVFGSTMKIIWLTVVPSIHVFKCSKRITAHPLEPVCCYDPKTHPQFVTVSEVTFTNDPQAERLVKLVSDAGAWHLTYLTLNLSMCHKMRWLDILDILDSTH